MDTALADTTTLSLLQGLSFLWLEITAKCNLECVHCYADSDPRQNLFGHMQTEDWLTVLRDSAHLGCKQVQFIGGEPTLHPALSRMISFASMSGYTFIEVFTNATILNEGLLKTFAEHNVHMATSFYSDDPETHDLITNHKGSFNHTVEGIRRIVATGLPIRAGIIEMPENVGHAERAKHFLEQLGVSEIKIDFQRGVGRGFQPLHSLQPMAELCGECWKGKLCVTSMGRTYPCVFSRFADLGTAKNGIQSIVSNDALIEFRGALKEYRRKREFREQASSQSKPLKDELCGPDIRCDPISSDCAPKNFIDCPPSFRCNPTCAPCGPVEYEPCGPSCHPNSPGCSPLDIYSPAEIEISFETGNSSCSPTTCSPCGPISFCVPKRMCTPDRQCNPLNSPCQPERSCAPTIRGSHQTEID